MKRGLHTTMGLVGCIARLLTDIKWPLKVLARLRAFTSTGGKLSSATGLVRGAAYTATTYILADVQLSVGPCQSILYGVITTTKHHLQQPARSAAAAAAQYMD